MKNMQFSCEFCMNFIWIWHKYLIAWKTYEKLFAWKLYIFHANIMRTYSHDICMRNFSSDFRMISAWFSCEKEIAWKLCEPLFPVYPDIKSNLNQQMRLLKKTKDNPKPAENTNHGRNQEVPGPTLPTVCTPSPKTVLNKEKGNAVKKP